MRNPIIANQHSANPVDYKKKLFPLFLVIAIVFIGFISLKKNTPAPAEQGLSSLAFADPAKSDIPIVQVFVPGFSVKEIPLNLTNINALRYGPDGRLYGLAYDGHIYVLTDTDGDGVEDKAVYWWDKSVIISPVGMVVAKEGIYVTSKDKVSLIKDTDNDGIGDKEEILTKDWVHPFVYTGTSTNGVDAFGIARDKNGDIYFALGTADFTNAFSIDSTGKSHYDIKSERGTVLRLTPGSSKREMVCTGTRFPVAMAFNSHGDLFATDQEGATWLPNGNPLDELLQIQTGRHYGFPPRHPKFLPNVIDEPSVFDYSPQHQSTCGLNFNVPINGGPVFGPAWWQDDAFVSGYSRGKIYRTTLVKTPAGYVAENSLFASVAALTVDACVSPKGDMVISTHSGSPDWGYGPQANGKLYKVIYTNKLLPSPVTAWSSKSDQVSIAFDRPLPKAYLTNLADKIQIEYGQYVGAGDRFEVYRPGYKAVERQMGFPREKLKVKNVDLSDDGKILLLNTFSYVEPYTYAITLPDFAGDTKLANSIKQSPTIDLSYNLNGVEMSWQSLSGTEKWSGWAPHLDMTVSNSWMKPVAPMSKTLSTPGRVTWKTKLNLYNMLRPNVQPESTIGYTLPPEDVTLIFKSSKPLQIKAGTATITEPTKKGDLYESKVTFSQVTKQAYDLEVSMNTTSNDPSLEVYYYTAEDSRLRALQKHRSFVPWAKDIYPNDVIVTKESPELAGGNWARGKKLFYGQAICSSCHSVGGKGQNIGPDLSNLVFRDYKSVLRDIHNPSAAINPDYVAYTVTLKNKKSYIGFVSYKKDSVLIHDISGHKTALSMKNVASTKALSQSLMPIGLDVMLGSQKMKDLLTFLLTTMKTAKIERPFLPPLRKITEVKALLQSGAVPVAKKAKALPPKTLRILWVSGVKDHGVDEHDYPVQQQRWAQLLSMAENVKITKATQWPTPAQFTNADVIVFYWNYQAFTEANGKQLDAFLQRGGGLVYLHYAVDATANPLALANRIGLAWKGGAAKFRHGRVELHFPSNSNPITKGFGTTTFEDESYWQLTPGNKTINVLATGTEDGKEQPLIWSTTQGKGRVFVSILGHYNWTFDDPFFRILLLRGIAWTGHQPTDRFNDLVTIGARNSE